MNKLPVGKTIIDAYGFTFGHLGAIIGLIWFPMVISTLLNFLPMLAGNYGDPGSTFAGSGAIEDLAVQLLTLLLSSVMYVAVARQALGLRSGQAVFYFALGQPEFRVYGGLLLIYFAVALVALAFVAGQSMPGAGVALAGWLAVPAVVLVFYLAIRFGFLLVPAIVVENRIDFPRVWSLMRGNFGRVIAILAAVALPLWIFEISLALLFIGHDVQTALPPANTTNPQVIAHHVGLLEEVLRRHMTDLMAISLILAPFNLGLILSASAYTYRALAGSAKNSRDVAA